MKRVAVSRPRLEREVETFRRALDIASEQEAKLLQLHSAIGLYRFLAARQRGDEAVEILSRIYARCDEGLSTSVCRTAEAILQAHQ